MFLLIEEFADIQTLCIITSPDDDLAFEGSMTGCCMQEDGWTEHQLPTPEQGLPPHAMHDRPG